MGRTGRALTSGNCLASFSTLESCNVPANKKAPSKKPAPSTKPLWQKLFIKGGTVLLVNAAAGYAKVLDGSPAK